MDCRFFNQPLDNWDVSNVTNMAHMFHNCVNFNQPLNNWNVSNVTNMGSMFFECLAFNQPLDKWNVSNVTDMESMFQDCLIFNQPLNNWDVSNVTNMEDIFADCDMLEEENKPIFKKKILESTQIDVIPIKIPKDATGYDLIDMGEVSIETYLKTNDNIVFLQFNKFFF